MITANAGRGGGLPEARAGEGWTFGEDGQGRPS